jgi:phosphoesterase RecJ-like protein
MTDTQKEVTTLKKLIEISSRILITSHISPDPDAVSSLLLMGTTLKLNFPDKNIEMVLEEEPLGLGFLEAYEQIKFANLSQSMVNQQSDLLIILDGNNYSRISRLDSEKISEYISKNKIMTVVIDHHEQNDKDQTNVFINELSPATAQTVYELLFDDLKLQMPPDAAKTALVGFYADTGGLVYLKPNKNGRVFDFAERLVKKGASVEQTKNNLTRYSEKDMRILSELASNISHESDYSFSFISDDFINKRTNDGGTAIEIQNGAGIFLNEYIRNIEGRPWGFIVYRNTLQGDDIYSASFRSLGSAKDVAAIANKLGGGGHKPAAGAKFEASSVQEAIDKVKNVIMEP